MTRKPPASAIGIAVAIAATLGGSAPALAYVGPGAGLSVLGALWGVLIAIFASLLFILIWPVRRAIKRRNRRAREAAPDGGREDGRHEDRVPDARLGGDEAGTRSPSSSLS